MCSFSCFFLIADCLKEILHGNLNSKGNERGNKHRDNYIFTGLRCWCYRISVFLMQSWKFLFNQFFFNFLSLISAFLTLRLLAEIKLTPLPVIFLNIYLLKGKWNPGFWWLTSFLKVSLKLFKSFRRYEEFLCQC